LKSEVSFNPLNHELSPKYEVLSEEERINLLKKYPQLRLSQML
jgi:DNA-directed RNA polymerase subunit H (RpoH/RPB5)